MPRCRFLLASQPSVAFAFVALIFALDTVHTVTSPQRQPRRAALAGPFWSDVRLVFANAGAPSKSFSLAKKRARCLRTETPEGGGAHNHSYSTWTRGQSRAYASAATATVHENEALHESWNVELSETSSSRERFDWRLRAPSRAKPGSGSAGDLDDAGGASKERYVKRVDPAIRPLQESEPFYDEVKAYSERFLPLMDAEQADEEEALKDRLSKWSVRRLQKEGYCIVGMSAYWLPGTQYGLPVAAFTLGPGVNLPGHKFEGGTQVLLTHMDPLKEAPIKGRVISSTSTHLRVSFQDAFPLNDGQWRMDLGFSNIAFERMRAAIQSFNQNPRTQEAESGVSEHEMILQGTHLRDVFLREFSPAPSTHEPARLQDPTDVNYVPHEVLEHASRINGARGGAFKDDMRIQSWARRYARVDPVRVEGDPVLEGLNGTQLRAVAMMIGERVSLVQGPPGTGKTKTIIEAVRLLKTHFEVAAPIAVCTYTNVAVDNVVEGLVAAGVKPLRIGYSKVQDSLADYTLDAALGRHELRPKLDSLIKEDEALSKTKTRLEAQIVKASRATNDTPKAQTKTKDVHDKLNAAIRRMTFVKGKMFRLRQKMVLDVLQQADAICTTCITSAVAPLRMIDFPIVFLDEASMATEPASLIPLMKGSRHVALIGDHKQLPPVIKTQEAQTNGLGISLFERLTEEGVVPSIMLDVQYRMHPSISRFPSTEFYNRALLDGTVDMSGNVPARLHPPFSSHLVVNRDTGLRPSVVFLDHTGVESAKGRSKINVVDAQIICSIIEDLLVHNEDLRGEDIGVISPYVAQVSLLSSLLTVDEAQRQRFDATLGSHRAMQLSKIEIKTVNGFEGREKDVVIFSTVRNNAAGHIGFLADRRRLNVGLTRAKRALFVVGGLSTLRVGKTTGMEEADALQGVGGRGAAAWRRYVEFLVRGEMVLPLRGSKLKEVVEGYRGSARPLDTPLYL